MYNTIGRKLATYKLHVLSIYHDLRFRYVHFGTVYLENGVQDETRQRREFSNDFP